MVWRKKSSTGGSSPAGRGGGEEEKVPRGHVPMVAGGGGEGDEFEGERVMVPVRLLSDPCIAELLDMAAQRYGYGQPGVLRIPCDAARFRRLVDGAMHRCGSGAASPSSPGRGAGSDEVVEKVPRGHVPMVTGGSREGDEGERVMVPVRLLSDPCIAELLDMAAQQYGYGQPGVLRVPCDTGHFRRLVDGAMHRCGVVGSALE
ncbi:hypothetical protein U9M48_010087 [Paspalum notatum var. saurae]|uniref:Auxin responsive protein n=1 Tax=Paspalum notatum var. saurae TaxID=547442 RepID=A0AAQ3SSC8_PASNO